MRHTSKYIKISALAALVVLMGQVLTSPSLALAASNAKAESGKNMSKPALAEPSRPVALPSLPMVNAQGTAVLEVSTTDDSKSKNAPLTAAAQQPAQTAPAQAAKKTSEQQEITPYSEARWRPPSKSSFSAEGKSRTVSVRLAGLPSPNVPPVYIDRGPSAQTLSREDFLKRQQEEEAAFLAAERLKKLEAEKQEKIKAKTPEEEAACAAMDAYKKQQLDAIQSDRQTLRALQNAVSELGLKKSMEFLATGKHLVGEPKATP